MEAAVASTPIDNLESGNMDHSKELDAGALFVLKSRGNQLAASYLITAGDVLPLLMLVYILGFQHKLCFFPVIP